MPECDTKITRFRNIKGRGFKNFVGGIIKGGDEIRLPFLHCLGRPWNSHSEFVAQAIL